MSTEDGSLRIAFKRTLQAVSLGGEVLWSASFPDDPDDRHLWQSQPLALADGTVCVTLPFGFVLFDETGTVRTYEETPEFMHQDTGTSPNIDAHGDILFSSIEGEVAFYRGAEFRTVGAFGHDIPVPSCYPDGTLGVASSCPRPKHL